jgi:hypothetical protein
MQSHSRTDEHELTARHQEPRPDANAMGHVHDRRLVTTLSKAEQPTLVMMRAQGGAIAC